MFLLRVLIIEPDTPPGTITILWGYFLLERLASTRVDNSAW